VRTKTVLAMVSMSGLLFGLVAATPASGAFAMTGPRPLPTRLFAPYFETYAGTDLAAQSKASGARFLTLAFLEAPRKGSCQVDWNGDPTTPVAWSTFGPDIAAIRARGGDVIPSFGGYSADHGGTDIADSCSSVAAIAAAYERVVTTYGVTRLDLDVEDRALNHPGAISRRNKAIHLVQQWAARHGRTVQFSYTLPSSMGGLDDTGVALLRDAVTQGAQVSVVNAMTFDFYDDVPHVMGPDSITAAKAVLAQMATVYPGRSHAWLVSHFGMTEMVGIDDFGPAETLTIADARVVARWAAAERIAYLSFWALQRDNGGCPGQAGADSCSGVAQAKWQFSHIFEPLTSSR
jgi:hypothetical protein